MGLAASALYLASIDLEENRTQKDIADAAGVTEVTIRNRCKDLRMIL
jgi:transcription initiation factor TFIIB